MRERYAIAYKPSKRRWLVLDNTKNNSAYGGSEVADTNAVVSTTDAEMAERLTRLLNVDEQARRV